MSSATETREWLGLQVRAGADTMGASLALGRLDVDVCCHEPAAHLAHLVIERA
jgi:hypothetical protein